MEKIFEMICRNSLIAVIFVLFICLVRLLTKRYSKALLYSLWVLLLVELLLPPVIRSPFSVEQGLRLYGEKRLEDEGPAESGTEKQEAVPQSGYQGSTGEPEFPFMEEETDKAAQNIVEDKVNNVTMRQEKTFEIRYLLSYVWAVAAVLLLGFFMVQYITLRKRTGQAVHIEDNVWEMEGLETPFVLTKGKPEIYLPTGIIPEAKEAIVAHEKEHIRHGDIWLKAVWTAALSLHWFNPFVWLAFFMMSRDMEMYCDERVLRNKSLEERKRYSRTLLQFSAKQSGIPLFTFFGESNTESRIRHILYSKKPGKWFGILFFVIMLGCAFVFLTSGAGKRESGKSAQASTAESETTTAQETASGTSAEREIESEAPAEQETEGGIVPPRVSAAEQALGVRAVSFVPEEEFLNRIAQAGDYSTESGWLNLPITTDEIRDTPKEKEIENAVNLIWKTENYTVYGTKEDAATIVGAPDGTYLQADVAFTTFHRVRPVIQEADFDKDGETELAIITHCGHGTGISLESLYMVDRADEGQYVMYKLTDDNYLAQLEPHYETEVSEDGVRLLVDGQPAGRTERNVSKEDLDNHYSYEAGLLIAFGFDGENILMAAKLVGDSDISATGYYEIPHGIKAAVAYEGEGNWKLEDFRYYDRSIESSIQNAIPLYYEENCYDYCMELAYEKAQEQGTLDVVFPDIKVSNITYPVHNLDSGEVEASATVQIEGADSYDYALIQLEYKELDNKGEWEIKDIAIEK